MRASRSSSRKTSTRPVNNRYRLFHGKLASISTRLAIFGTLSQLVRFRPVQPVAATTEFPSCSTASPDLSAACDQSSPLVVRAAADGLTSHRRRDAGRRGADGPG